VDSVNVRAGPRIKNAMTRRTAQDCLSAFARWARECLRIDTKGPLSSGHAWHGLKWDSDRIELLALNILLHRLFPSASGTRARNITLSYACKDAEEDAADSHR
jgi:hypothetical protein